MEKLFSQRPLGKSNLMVSPIGLGCWQFSKRKGMGGKFWSGLGDNEIKDIVKVSLEGGINWFDTAEAYGWGESEKALTGSLKILGKSSDKIIIATKWWPMFRTATSITRTIDKRIAALNNYRIDLYQIHQSFSFSSIKTEMKEMAKLVNDHKICFIGVSNFPSEKMKIANDELARYGLHLTSNQVKYSLLYRKIETNGILSTAKKLGISIIAYSPLAQGILTGKFHDNPELIKDRPGFRKYMNSFKQKGLDKSLPIIKVLKELAEKYKVTPSQIALNWLISFHGDLIVAIPGATKMSQAKDNAASMKFKLTKNELDYLDKISAPFKS